MTGFPAGGTPGPGPDLVIGTSVFPPTKALSPDSTFVPNPFIRIDSNGTVTLVVSKSEMGQEIYTSLPMLIAEELECDWNAIHVETGPAGPAYNDPLIPMMFTGGSCSIANEWDRLSLAGAAAREMLIAAAAKTWGVDPKSCHAENSRIFHETGKSLSYGELAGPASKMEIPRDVRVKDPKTWKILGKSRVCIDNRVKVNGTARYGIDSTFPGMLTAVIERSPVFGGNVKSFDAEKAKAIAGVKDIIQVPSGIAVIATGFAPAQKARGLLKVTWDEGEGAKVSTPGIREEYRKLVALPGTVARRVGDPARAITAATKKIVAEYEVPYLAHACMEPLNATVDLRPEGCDVWTGTQLQTFDRGAASTVSGLPLENVRIHTMFMGGGFGRRGNPDSDFVTGAVQVAKAVKQPVRVMWSREDDTRGGMYRPLWYDRISAGIDQNNRITGWRHTIAGQSITAGGPFEALALADGIDSSSVEGAKELPYAIPNIQVDLHTTKNPVIVGQWRSVGHSHTAFVVESFFDEVAHAAGKDPYEFRRELLTGKPRHLGVIELAAQKAGWGTPLPPGRARGIALAESFGSFVAQVAEVSVDPAGKVRVHRVVCAIDCGMHVNSDTIAAQMEGGIVFGLSAALHGEITLKDGRVEQSNFNNYPVLRMNEMPEVEVHIVESNEKPGGVGEPGVPAIAPAVCNAIFTLTGKRIRKLPIRPEELKAS